MRPLTGQLGIVTGGGSGIGAAVCRLLAASGAAVIAADAAASEPLSRGPEAGSIISARIDVRDPAGVTALFSAAAPVDFLVNCAGIGGFGPVAAISLETWKDVIDTNLTGSFLCCREAIRCMAHGGRIINIGSISGVTPLAGNGPYGVSKCALRMLSALINEDHWSQGIRSTYLTLGAVATRIWETRPEFAASDMLQPDDVAKIIAGILETPLPVRMDEVTVCPPKGVL